MGSDSNGLGARLRWWAVAIGVTCGVFLCGMQTFAYSKTAHTALWQALELGLFGEALKSDPFSPRALNGIPDMCGNAYPLRTLPWMNPSDFNASVITKSYEMYNNM